MQRALFLIVTLGWCCAMGCQTSSKMTDKEAEILMSQKSIIATNIDGGQFKKAIEDLRPLLREYPDDHELHNLMGLTQLGLNNTNRAVSDFEHAYKISPQPFIALNLSTAYIETGSASKAVQLLLKVRKQAKAGAYYHPDRVSHNLGMAYERLGKSKRAEAFYKEALEDNPTYYLPALALARMYEKSKQPAKTRKYLEQAYQICAKCYDVVHELTAFHIKAKRSSKAIELWQEYLKSEGLPDHERIAAQEQLMKIPLKKSAKG